jgi:Zn-dependent peptidase ImmA (M78 family)
MVKMVPDSLGRFPRRPYYENAELDRECEAVLGRFLRRRRGEVRFPVDTDDLRSLIEEYADALDNYADLSAYGDSVEGMTRFFADQAPAVFISERLANDPRRVNRLRTTLTHEFGHVYFHRQLYDAKFAQTSLFDRREPENVVCKRDTILGASQYDWAEWQAGYVSGAILMPVSAVHRIVGDYRSEKGQHGDIVIPSDAARALIGLLIDAFAVSEEAARVRLIKLGLLTTGTRTALLFG